MTDDEVEAVAQAIAKARRSSSAEGREPAPGDVSEQHRMLARLAIATLEWLRATPQAAATVASCDEVATECPDED